MFSHVGHDEICGKEWVFTILNVKTFFYLRAMVLISKFLFCCKVFR